MARPSGREPGELRAVEIERGFTKHAAGSVLVAFGDTRVLCTASVEDRVPPFLRGRGEGWITAEWRHTRNNRRAKIYSLTPPGRRYPRQETANWERLSQAITHVVRLTEA